MTTTIYYKNDSVVIRKDGKDVMSYKSVEELVESHIKGLIAAEKDPAKALELLQKYRYPGSDQ